MAQVCQPVLPDETKMRFEMATLKTGSKIIGLKLKAVHNEICQNEKKPVKLNNKYFTYSAQREKSYS